MGRLRYLLAGICAMTALLAGCALPPQTGAEGAFGSLSGTEGGAAHKRGLTHLDLAVNYFQAGEYQIALSEAREALAADASLAGAYNVAGMAYVALGDRANAESQYKRALQLNPRDANVVHNLAWMECEEGRYAEAEEQFQQALALPNADRSRTLMAQGICQARAGDKQPAIATLESAYALNAGNPIIGYNLALLLYQSGNYEQARFYARRLNNSELANAQSLWLGMRIAHREGSQRTVSELATQLQKRFPDSQEWAAYERERFDE